MAKEEWGSKRERRPGVWELRYTVDGEPKSETLHGTERQALARLAVLESMCRRGELRAVWSLDTFFWGEFVPECEMRVESGRTDGNDSPLALTTFKGYVRYYKKHISPVFGEMPLDAIRARSVQAWLYTMTAGAAKHALAVFKVVMNRAEALEHVDHHPLNKRYLLPSKTSGRGRSKDKFDASELIDIFRECRGEWWEPFYILAAFGGGQRAEAVGVRPAEIDYIEDEVGLWAVAPVVRGVHNVDGEVTVEDHAKNEYREDALIVPPPFSTRLRVLAVAAQAEGASWFGEDFGGPPDPEAVTRAWKRWLGGTSHRYVPYGNLRNSYSTMLHALGLEDSLVSSLLRHSNLQTDYEHYNRLTVEEKIALLGKAVPEMSPDASGTARPGRSGMDLGRRGKPSHK